MAKNLSKIEKSRKKIKVPLSEEIVIHRKLLEKGKPIEVVMAGESVGVFLEISDYYELKERKYTAKAKILPDIEKKINALHKGAGLLADLSPQEMKNFEAAIKRRPLFPEK